MHHRLFAPLVGVSLIITACGVLDQQVEQAAEEIVATSLAATSIAQTLGAPTQTPMVVTATPDPNQPPEPIPTPNVDTTIMSEEELAAAIDAAVADALAASEQASATTTAATSDGTLSEDETITVQVEMANADVAIDTAEALIYAYYDLYGAYAEEAITVLQAIESDLTAIQDDVDYVATTVEQGVEVANSVAAELTNAAVEASANAAQAQTDAQALLTQLQAERDERLQEVLAAAPTEVASEPRGAVLSAGTYMETVRGSLSDRKVSAEELSAITQASANATASLEAQAIPELQGLSDSIKGMTNQIARGDVPQASANFAVVESQFQGLSSRPEFSAPDGSGIAVPQPQQPERPSRSGG